MMVRLCDLCGEKGEICHTEAYTTPAGDEVIVEITLQCATDYNIGLCRQCASKLFTSTIGTANKTGD